MVLMNNIRKYSNDISFTFYYYIIVRFILSFIKQMTKEEMKKILKEIKRLMDAWDGADLLEYLDEISYDLEDLD